ncbi:MAG: hypothetical protein ABR521_04320 [Gaiellaceae bacterium]
MRLLALAALAALALVPAASAHGDPVSDRLLAADVYLPEKGASDAAARRLADGGAGADRAPRRARGHDGLS